MEPEKQFETLVTEHYEALYRFAISLTHNEFSAADLTQHTFYVWAVKGSQLRDISKAKTWLFTTLYRAFIDSGRNQKRFTHIESENVAAELPEIPPESVSGSDHAQVLDALAGVDEVYRGAVILFYLEDCSYREIAAILGVRDGTVKSRISRGIAQLRRLLCGPSGTQTGDGALVVVASRNKTSSPVSHVSTPAWMPAAAR